LSGRFKPEEVLREHRATAVLVGVDLGNPLWPIDESLAELERLVHTASADVVATATQRLDHPHPRTFIGKGTALILEIFAMHAVSREGKLQVELAQLEYLLPRLRGLWGHLERERLGGGRGARFGAGESQLETDRRLARRRISDLKRELKTVRASRELQRKARADSGVYKVAVVGYTNAGKSTLLNAITDADVLVQDMLFATLDSTTRRLTLPEGREVLSEIDAANTPKVLVLNQMDKLEEDDAAALRRRHPDAVFMSARTGVGTDELMERISYEAARGSATLTVLIPYTRGDLVQLAHERAHVVSERHTGEGTQLVLQAPQGIADKFAVFSIEAEPAES
jgi:GTP-binding protein HflX